MIWYYCSDCDKVFREDEIGSRPEFWRGEAWGMPFIQTEYYDCCPKCGEEVTETEECICRNYGLKPKQRICDACHDKIEHIVSDLRKLFPDAKYNEKSTIIEIIFESWW